MSTKNIEAMLLCLRTGTRPSDEVVSDAGRELVAIREAAHEVVTQKALEDWQSCMPVELADAIRLLQSMAKEAP